MKKTTLIKLIASALVATILVIGVILVSEKLDRENPFIDALEFTNPYDESQSKEANVELWLKAYLEQDNKWYRKDRTVSSYQINHVSYASLNYFRVELDLVYKGDKKLNAIEPIMYMDMIQMSDQLYYNGMLSETEYIERNKEFDMSDVNYDQTRKEKLQVKKGDDGTVVVSKNAGKTWTTIPVSYDLVDDAYVTESGKNISSFFYEFDTLALAYVEDTQTYFTISRDKGVTWQTHVIGEGLGYDDKTFYRYHNPSIVAINKDDVLINVTVDAAMGSVQNVLIQSRDGGMSFTYHSDMPSSKQIISVGQPVDGHYYMLDRNYILWESKTDDWEFTAVPVPEYSDDVWDFEFNDVFIALEIPFINEQNELILQVSQGDNGDIKADAFAEFESKDKGDTWQFKRYVQYKDKIVD